MRQTFPPSLQCPLSTTIEKIEPGSVGSVSRQRGELGPFRAVRKVVKTVFACEIESLKSI